ncbi:GIY-YIG nuclease family protein [Neobacillus sp. LXY-1]|uniref:GIY-YIG nuclease family protein n=1 Tax=Neobacillus sp. LXY-1 TaxID=3379133 RepID=UPI003EE170C5
MDKQRRKQLQEDYKQIKTYMGIIRITNLVNGKMYVASYPNLKNRWLTIKTQLEMGNFPNHQLQKDWNELSEESFTFEVLEQKETTDISDVKWALKQMIKPWLDKLQPYGEKGYLKPEK